MSAAVSVQELTRRFGDFVAVDGVSFEIARGEVFGLLGANGAGKTTIIRMLCAIYRPSSGNARVLGFDTRSEAAEIRARVGYMSQRFSLYGDLTLEENLRFYAAVYGRGALDSVEQVLEQVGVTAEQRGARADALPTGIRQRAALAAAIAHQPELLFLDEPTSGVDPRSRTQFWALIKALAARGTTVLVTTHAMGEAEGCDRIALMSAGRMVATGSPDRLIDETGIQIVAVDADPWQHAYELIRARWPQAALYGRRAHIPAAEPAAVTAQVRDVLGALDVHAITIERPSLEDAFVWHIGAAPPV